MQGRHDTDVNNLVADLARKLGGKGLSLHAPAITDTPKEREALLALRQVREVLELANNAQIALVGIGAVRPATASLFQFASLSEEDILALTENRQATGEILLHLVDRNGKPVKNVLNDRIVSMDLDTFRKIPLTIGIAAMQLKTAPIISALRGGYIKVLVTDEETAEDVLSKYQSSNSAL
jgi:DNA-binding transcriptional regulator LsrR (DeoR family)